MWKGEYDLGFTISYKIICFLGKNGSGKTTVFKAIKYFFDNISKKYSEESVIDCHNPYTQKCTISISFDVKLLRIKAEKNKALAEKFKKIDNYFLNIFSENGNYIDFDHIELQMVQYKDGMINWSIPDKEIRETIKHLFPLYYIDTRNLDLLTWNKLWDIICDLSVAVPKRNKDECTQILDQAFSQIYGDKYDSSKEIISNMFKEKNISLDQFHFDSKFKNAFSMRFGGESFQLNDQKLNYYSDGTNSFNYLIAVTSLIPKISEISCKSPIFIIDEPEIGLHNEFIKIFVNEISQSANKNTTIMLSTHSPTLIAEITYNTDHFSLFKVNYSNHYTTILRMNEKWLTQSNHRVTVLETECYFCDYLVYVEGETELQLFTHKRILELFPALKKIHFYSFNSNDERLRFVHAETLNLGINYKLIIDIDKIIQYKPTKKKFVFSSDNYINVLKNEQEVKKNKLEYYSNYRESSHNLYTQIMYRLKMQYNYAPNCHYFDSKHFNTMMELVRHYCYSQNIIVNWTTIEGELITYENIDKFIAFLETQSLLKPEEHNKIISNISDLKEKTVCVLYEFNGCTEAKDKKVELTINNETIKLQRQVSSKTSGIVKNWIEFYFSKYLDLLEKKHKKNQFKKDFPLLFDTLQKLENMVQ